MYSAIDWPTIAGILGTLESPYGDDGTFIMKRSTFFTMFYAATDDNGRPLVTTLPAVGAPGTVNYYIGGRPVIFSNRIPTANSFIYGDLSQYIVNESQEIVIEASAVSGFDNDETTWRGKVYAGGRPMFPKQTFTYYTYSGT
ncbi:MAG: phage major capsid protein [Eubacteriales bacterium]